MVTRFPRWVTALAALVAVLVLAYAVPAVVLAGEVPRGTVVAGVELGGLSPADARSRLERAIGRRPALPFTLVLAGRKVRVTPAELGLSYDLAATVEAAMAGAGTPAGVARSLFGAARAIEPKLKVDDRRLTGKLTDLAGSVDAEPREGGVRYRGLEPRAVLPKAGRALDRDQAAAAVRQAFLGARESVTLRVRVVPPAVPAAEVRKVAAGQARTAVAMPLTLANGGRTAIVSRERLAANLRFTADGARLRPRFDASRIAPEVTGALVAADRRPRDASFEIVKGRPRVVPAREGRGVEAGALGRAVAAALEKGERQVAAPVTTTPPRVTTRAAAKLGIKEKVSSFTSRYPCCAPRVTNIHRIADLVDGHVVLPGETFSLNGVVGKRDKARGFVEAPMILNNRFVNDVGGGVSQFATTMFNAVFFGGFQDVQHSPHQYYISRYPAGRESTVSFPQPDFRWRNDSPYGVLVRASYTGTSVTVQFWSTKRYDISSTSSPRYQVKPITTIEESGPDCIPMGGSEGFAIDVWRTFKKDGKVLRKQRFHTVYDAEPKLVCR
ncbi:VanW family protein [Nonomuraea sp. NBC_01738]|uniref:VanW family protein n=1 Tax=Nonomuraea sp. NBC_01738 TaxID=2976003 RepID=UPI002E14C450|nr:VanW family protein [Nonomuraea sp. NBC_01738]